MFCAGAGAVMIGTALFRNLNLFDEITAELPSLLEKLSVLHLSDLIGRAHKD